MKTILIKTNGITSVLMVAFLSLVLAMISGCGSSTGAIDTVTEDRLISGSIDASMDSEISKSQAPAADEAATEDCVGDVCSIRAMNTNGEEVNGQIYRNTNRWEIRLRAGQWLIGFHKNSGELAGYLELNGMMAFQVENGEDIDVGGVRSQNGRAVNTEDVEGLGEHGLRSAFGADSDFDGIPDILDQDMANDPLDLSIFQVTAIKPFDDATHVAPCRPVKIYFSTPIDEATLNSVSVSVTEDVSPLEGVLSYEVIEEEDLDGEAVTEYVVMFTSNSSYTLGSTINVVLPGGADGLLSSTGEQLPSSYDFSFVVRDFGGTSSQCHDPDSEHYQLRQQERERAGGDNGNR